MAIAGARYAHKPIILLSFLLLVASLLGHFLADSAGLSLDSLLPVDLHGGFLLAFSLSLSLLLLVTILILPWLSSPLHWSLPPTPPIPIV